MATLRQQSALNELRTESLAKFTPISTQIKKLEVTTPEAFAQADMYLSRIVQERKILKARVRLILDPIETARKELLTFRDELDNPWADAELAVRDGMKEFKRQELLEELKAAAEANRKAAESRRLAAEADRKAEQLQASAARDRLQARAEELRVRADVQETARPVITTKVAGSTTRALVVAEVKDRKAFLAAVISGLIPDDVIDINQNILDRYARQDRATVESWPGVKVTDDVTIVKARERKI